MIGGGVGANIRRPVGSAREERANYGVAGRLAGPRLGLLDTSVVVAILRRYAPTLRLMAILQTQRTPVPAITSVVRYEIERGLGSSAAEERWLTWVHAVRELPFEGPDAAVAGTLDCYLRANHEPIGDLDVLIAAAALRRRAPLITYNVRHFSRVPALVVRDANTWNPAG